jgi:predicted nucleic-acid-binding protein
MAKFRNKILLDTNVCLDLLTKRKLQTRQKKQMFSLILKNNIEVWVPSCSIDTIYYILNSSMKIKSERSKELITTLLRYTSTLPLNDKIIKKALKSDFKDFEDALINFTAEDKNIGTIITFNKKDFKNSSLEILTPSELIHQLI